MTPEEAFALVEKHIDAELVAVSTLRQTAFGFYFHVPSEAYLRTGDMMDMPVGSFGVLVDRNTGKHDLGSTFGLDCSLEAYDRGLHQPMDVAVESIGDRRRAVSALGRLQMSNVTPEIAHGETWTIPQHYNQRDFIRAFESAPNDPRIE